MKIFKCVEGIVIEDESETLYLASASTAPPPPTLPPVDWDVWTNRDDLYDFLVAATHELPAITVEEFEATMEQTLEAKFYKAFLPIAGLIAIATVAEGFLPKSS